MNDDEFNACVHKYRDEAAVVLQFQPSIELLLDAEYCKGIDATVHSFGNAKWERHKAVEGLGEHLPDERGLYAFVWKPQFAFHFAAPPTTERFSWVLYIGKAGILEGSNDSIKHRYLSEYRKYVGRDPSTLWNGAPADRREARLAAFLTLRPLEYWFLLLDSVRDISILERKLIRMFRPPLNKQHGLTMRPGKPVPAFEEPQ